MGAYNVISKGFQAMERFPLVQKFFDDPEKYSDQTRKYLEGQGVKKQEIDMIIDDTLDPDPTSQKWGHLVSEQDPYAKTELSRIGELNSYSSIAPKYMNFDDYHETGYALPETMRNKPMAGTRYQPHFDEYSDFHIRGDVGPEGNKRIFEMQSDPQNVKAKSRSTVIENLQERGFTEEQAREKAKEFFPEPLKYKTNWRNDAVNRAMMGAMDEGHTTLDFLINPSQSTGARMHRGQSQDAYAAQFPGIIKKRVAALNKTLPEGSKLAEISDFDVDVDPAAVELRTTDDLHQLFDAETMQYHNNPDTYTHMRESLASYMNRHLDDLDPMEAHNRATRMLNDQIAGNHDFLEYADQELIDDLLDTGDFMKTGKGADKYMRVTLPTIAAGGAASFPAFAKPTNNGITPMKQNATLGGIAGALQGTQDFLNRGDLSTIGMLTGEDTGLNLGDLLMGGFPGMIEDWSYGQKGSIKDRGYGLADKRLMDIM